MKNRSEWIVAGSVKHEYITTRIRTTTNTLTSATIATTNTFTSTTTTTHK